MDLAGISADRGMRPVVILDDPLHEDFATWSRDADALIIGASSAQALASPAAYEKTRRAVRLLATVDPELLHVEYRSTFDSSAGSTVGSAIDAAMDETNESFTIALPDGPSNGHPSEGDLTGNLQAQTRRRVGLIPNSDLTGGSERVRQRIAQLRSDGVEIAIIECTSEQGLQNVCAAISDLRLITGSSALATRLPLSWPQSTPVYPQRRSGGRGFLVVSGSRSRVTRQQNAWLAAHKAIVITLEATNLAVGSMPDSVLTPICEELASGGTCILQTSDNVAHVHGYFGQQNKSEAEIAETIARSLATFTRDVISLIAPEGLIVAGSETASIVSQVLGFGALAVGPSIEPGIPVSVTISGSALPFVLKAGDAGSERFYRHAIETMKSLEYLA